MIVQMIYNNNPSLAPTNFAMGGRALFIRGGAHFPRREGAPLVRKLMPSVGDRDVTSLHTPYA
jgi:hypothetical protein